MSLHLGGDSRANVIALRKLSVGSLPVSSSWRRLLAARLTAASCETRWTRREHSHTESAGVCPVPVCHLFVCTYLSVTCLTVTCLSHSHLSEGLSQRLVRLLSDSDSALAGVEDRQVSERLWVLFLSALENFLSDLRKACDLIGQFPLMQRYDRRSLVNTGQLMASTSCLSSSVIS